MRFSVDVHDTEVAGLLGRLVDITGVEAWQRRFEWLVREADGNQFMGQWLRERCLIEWTCYEVLNNQPVLQGVPFRVENMAQYELVAFAAGVVRTYERLSEPGRRRLRGSLIDGLKGDKGLGSLQHEIVTAVHLMRRGFEVEFWDMERGSGFDFLARKEDVELEVECKMFSADLGRKVHRRRSATLFKVLEPLMVQTYRAAETGIVVAIKIPDHLTPSPIQHRGIEQAVRTGLLSGDAVTTNEFCEVRVMDFARESSPFSQPPQELTQQAFEQFVRQRTGLSNPTTAALYAPERSPVLVALGSAKADEVLKGMRRQLRDAANDQLTKTRPSVLAVQLQDVSDGAMEELAKADSSSREKATALQIMTSDLLQSPSRAHVHSVVYRSHGRLTEDPGRGMKEASGIAYFIKNRNNPYCDDPGYSAFGV